MKKLKYSELREEEKAELRQNLFFESLSNDGYTDFAYLSNAEARTVKDCSCPEEIPESIMHSAYDMYDFVEEDFWCNI